VSASGSGAAHLEFSPVIFADRLIAGFVWCLVYARTGRLLPGMMAHAANNAVVAPFARRPGRVLRPEAVIA
jgi:membrane protease YdiL (CAAX protease family)